MEMAFALAGTSEDLLVDEAPADTAKPKRERKAKPVDDAPAAEAVAKEPVVSEQETSPALMDDDGVTSAEASADSPADTADPGETPTSEAVAEPAAEEPAVEPSVESSDGAPVEEPESTKE